MKMNIKHKGGKGRPKSKRSSSSRQADYAGFFSKDNDTTKDVASNGFANHELVSVFENSYYESHSKDDTSARTMNRFGGMALTLFLEAIWEKEELTVNTRPRPYLHDSESFLQTVKRLNG